VATGAFREDLFYRLNVFPIPVPPLRDRPEDIPTLVWAFVEEFSRALGKRFESIADQDMEKLRRWRWPGNVRELKNTIERSVIVSTGPRLRIDLPRVRPSIQRNSLQMADVEREHLRAVLEQTGWKIRGHQGASEALGLKPSTLESRMSKLGLRRPAR
jgi:transcriptional regulator with GAF, ATPase, and Fis domain